jgi:ABC-type branched-subunit amino acid transport system substrate-binding protein
MPCGPSDACSLLATAQCPFVYGNPADSRSLRFGALFDLTGAEAETGQMQARASELAIDELNAAGGLRIPNEVGPRPLALVVCDSQISTPELQEVLSQLNVKALLGPAWTQSFAAAARDVPTDAVLLLGPLALRDAEPSASNFRWGLTAAEADRVPLLTAQLRVIEAQLAVADRPIKLAYVMRTDSALTSVRLAAQTVAADRRRDVGVFEYASAAELPQLAAMLALPEQQPDIVLTDGASEAIELVELLERALPSDAQRPQYLLTEAAQTRQLLTLAAANETLQQRVTVIGAVPTASAASVHAGFETAYWARYGQHPSAVTGLAASYSAVYGVAYATLAADAPLHDAASLANALQAFDPDGMPLSTAATSVTYAVDALAAGEPVSVTGTLSELRWDEQGSPLGAQVGVYCLRPPSDGTGWRFRSTGYAYDVDRAAFSGQTVSCATASGRKDPDGTAPATPPDTQAAAPTSGAVAERCAVPGAACTESPDANGCACGDDSSACDLTGVYALKLTVPVTWPATSLLTAGRGEFVSWAHVQLSQSGSALQGTVVPCGQTVPDFSNAILIAETYGVEYPASIFDRTPMLPGVPSAGTIGGAMPGASFSLGRTAWLAGITLRDPVEDVWPNTFELMPRDDDADGEPAITGLYKRGIPHVAVPVDSAAAARADRGFIAVRIVFDLEGSLSSCTQSFGAANVQAIDSHTVGCSLSVTGLSCTGMQANHLDTNTPSYSVGASSYALQKVADQASCSDVRAALP